MPPLQEASLPPASSRRGRPELHPTGLAQLCKLLELGQLLGSFDLQEEGRKQASANWLSEKLLVQVPTKRIRNHHPWLQLSAFPRMCISSLASIKFPLCAH